MSIWIYCSIIYIILAEIFGIVIAICNYRDAKENKEMWTICMCLCMPVVPILYLICCICNLCGLDVASLFEKSKPYEDSCEIASSDGESLLPKIQTICFLGLPFSPVERQVIYVEDVYNDVINAVIKKHYDQLCYNFDQYGLTFVYLPIETSREWMEKRLYALDLDKNGMVEYPEAISSDFMVKYLSNYEDRKKLRPSLIWFDSAEKSMYTFNLLEIKPGNDRHVGYKEPRRGDINQGRV